MRACAAQLLPLRRLAMQLLHHQPTAATSTRALATASKRRVYVCADCGADAPKWAGQCPACAAWDTLREFRPEAAPPTAGGQFRSSPAAFRGATAAKAAAWAADAAGAAATRSWLRPPAPGGGGGGSGGGGDDADAARRLTPLSRIGSGAGGAARVSTGSAELDRLFGGGGVVAGSVTLLGGAPGAGKSTLLLQLCALLARGAYVGAEAHGAPPRAAVPYADFFCGRDAAARRAAPPARPAHRAPPPLPPRFVAYVSGEESASQLQWRAARLGLDVPGLLVLNETRVEAVLEQLTEAAVAAGAAGGAGAAAADGAAGGAAVPPAAPQGLAGVVIDSIQTVYAEGLPGAAGSVAQVRECAVRLTQWAKASGVPVVLVGHVTKAGDLGGPRTLEHLVDTVLFIEGEDATSAGAASSSLGDAGFSMSGGGGGGGGGARLLRAVKNRFGSTSEVGIFRMGERGFQESSPARLFLSRPLRGAAEGSSDLEEGGGEPSGGPPPGCAVTVTQEGSRPLCVEVQALATARYAAFPRHRAMGITQDRLFMLAAVLSRHTPLRPRPSDTDLLVNVVGGLRISDPAADLAIAVAVASTLLGVAPPAGAVFLGELGLGGEVRAATSGGAGAMTRRLRTAAALGFTSAFVPVGTRLPLHSPGGGGGDGGERGPAGGLSDAATAAAAAAAGAAPLIRLVPVRTVGDAVQRAFGAAALQTTHQQRRTQQRAGGASSTAAAAELRARAASESPREWYRPQPGSDREADELVDVDSS